MNKKIVMLPYDMDTSIGINNEGSLVFSYNLEDIDSTSGGADIYNGQQSVLWKNLREMFPDELRAMYQNLRSTGALLETTDFNQKMTTDFNQYKCHRIQPISKMQ